MGNFTFYAPTRVYFGRKEEERIGSILKQEGCHRVLVHYGGQSAVKSGLLFFCTRKLGWGWKNFVAEANAGKGLRFPEKARGYVSYVLPLIVMFIFLFGLWEKFTG